MDVANSLLVYVYIALPIEVQTLLNCSYKPRYASLIRVQQMLQDIYVFDGPICIN